MTTTADLHTLTGAYAAHALPDPERTEFRRHLTRCPACTQEVRELRAALARLGAAQTTTAPPGIEARVMAGIGSVRQLRPRGPDPTDEGGVHQNRRRRLARSWPRFALAASVAAAIGLGGVAVDQHHDTQRAQQYSVQLQEQTAAFSHLLTAPDVRTSTATAGSGAGTVVWSHSRGQAGFLAAALPSLTEGKVYELWFDDAGAARPAGLLASSTGSVLLQGPVDGATGVGVTVEPTGGSLQPTSLPLLLLPLG
ncbi:anti-sigma factor [Kitasatospora sp. NPDC048540]|uniref:anti-sigma factor n=1 Tax=unclassified Kitasatospora TaxID=2633591 RepID=UPI000539BFFF|nr:anti-sigma factor [Kitasatospora sp. MBT63]